MALETSQVLFTFKGIDVDLSLFCAIFGIFLIGVLQLSWPTIQAYAKRPRQDRVLAKPPLIEVISEDPKEEKARKRFRRDKQEIANWAQSAPSTSSDRELQQTSFEDPNSMLPAGLVDQTATSGRLNEQGQVLDTDGSVLEEGTIAYIRQQIVDRVINTGEDDGSVSAVIMKLDLIKAIKALSDPEVIEWYTHNKEMLKY